MRTVHILNSHPMAAATRVGYNVRILLQGSTVASVPAVLVSPHLCLVALPKQLV